MNERPHSPKRDSGLTLDSIRCFDPKQPFSVLWRDLPHWAQAGTIVFITWRAGDSLPRQVIERWIRERILLLHKHGIIVPPADNRWVEASWKDAVERLPPEVRRSLKWQLSERWDSYLDECHGACLLRRPELAEIVANSLLKFDGERYVLTDFVVMPNHVHLLVAFPDEDSMISQCAGWRRFTARAINQKVGRTGEYWQEDGFDHLVRSPDQFGHFRGYIANNGPKARLTEGEYLWYSKSQGQRSLISGREST